MSPKEKAKLEAIMRAEQNAQKRAIEAEAERRAAQKQADDNAAEIIRLQYELEAVTRDRDSLSDANATVLARLETFREVLKAFASRGRSV